MNAPADLPVVDRKRFIGGSDAAAICGLSPWKTPLAVYYQKRGESDPDARELDPGLLDLLETGKEMEPVIRNRLRRLYGVKITKVSTEAAPNRYQDAEFPFLAAEVDFEFEVTEDLCKRFDFPLDLVGTIQNGEVKNVHQFATAQFGQAETDEVPVQYATQGMHGLMVTNRRLCLYAVQLGSNIAVYWIFRDDQIIRDLRAAEVKFWNQHVLAGVPPKPIDLPDVMKLFKKVYASECEATPEVADMVQALAAANDAKNAAEAQAEELKFKIGLFMLGETGVFLEKGSIKPGPTCKPGVHLLLRAGAPLLKVGVQHQDRLDTARVKSDYPEVAAECIKKISFVRFDHPRAKKRAA